MKRLKKKKKVGLKIYTSAYTYGLSLWYPKLYWVIERKIDRQTEKERELDKFYFTIIYLLFHLHTLRPRPYFTRTVIDSAL